jgi:hypothetical protein
MGELQQVRIRVEEDEDLTAAQEVVAEIPEIEMEALSKAPKEGGVEGQIGIIEGILIAGGVTLVARFVTNWWEKRRGGLVVDQRPTTKDQVYRDKDVPYGFVLVFPADGGQVKIETKDMPKDALDHFLESIINGGFKTVTDLAKAAAEAVGEDKVEPSPKAGPRLVDARDRLDLLRE